MNIQLHINNITEETRYKGGKSFRKYCFTLKDIARAKGKSLSTVRNDKYRGRFDPDDIKSVVEYVSR